MTIFLISVSIIFFIGLIIFIATLTGTDSSTTHEEDEPFSEEFVDFMDGDDNNFF